MSHSQFSSALSTVVAPWFIMGVGLAVLFPLPVPYGLVSLSNLAAIFADLVPSIIETYIND